MFNDSLQGVSTLSFALTNSLKEFIEQNTFEDQEEDKSNFFNDSGDIYIPHAKTYSIEDMNSGEFPSFDPENSGEASSWEDFYSFRSSYLSNDITTITFNETLFLPTFLKQLSENKEVYGVVLENTELTKSASKKFLFNPLHPVNAFLIAANLIEIPSRGKLHIFEYRENTGISKKATEEAVKYYEREYSKLFDKSGTIINENIVMSQEANVPNSEVTSLIESPFIETINTKIKINRRAKDDKRSNIKTLIVPTQLAIDSMVTPYYGLIHITDPASSNATAVSLSPMGSGNINSGYGYSGQRGRRSTGNICVGSESYVSRKGWFTLSKINLGSMFHQDIVDLTNVLEFAQASKIIAGKIWATIEEEHLAQLEEA